MDQLQPTSNIRPIAVNALVADPTQTKIQAEKIPADQTSNLETLRDKAQLARSSKALTSPESGTSRGDVFSAQGSASGATVDMTKKELSGDEQDTINRFKDYTLETNDAASLPKIEDIKGDIFSLHSLNRVDAKNFLAYETSDNKKHMVSKTLTPTLFAELAKKSPNFQGADGVPNTSAVSPQSSVETRAAIIKQWQSEGYTLASKGDSGPQFLLLRQDKPEIAEAGLLRYHTGDGKRVIIDVNVTPELYNRVNKMAKLADSKPMLAAIDKARDEGKYALDQIDGALPAYADIKSVESGSAAGLLLYTKNDGTKHAVNATLTPALYGRIEAIGIKAGVVTPTINQNTNEGYKLVDSAATAPAFINYKSGSFSVANDVIRYETKNGKKEQVSKDFSPESYAQTEHAMKAWGKIAIASGDHTLVSSNAETAAVQASKYEDFEAVTSLGDGVLSVEIKNAGKFLVSQDLSPELFASCQGISALKSSPDDVKVVNQNLANGYAMADSETKAPSVINGFKTIEKVGEVFRYETLDGKKIQVAKQITPELYEQVAQLSDTTIKINDALGKGYSIQNFVAERPRFNDLISKPQDLGLGIISYETKDGIKLIVSNATDPERYRFLINAAAVLASAEKTANIKDLQSGPGSSGILMKPGNYTLEENDDATAPKFQNFLNNDFAKSIQFGDGALNAYGEDSTRTLIRYQTMDGVKHLVSKDLTPTLYAAVKSQITALDQVAELQKDGYTFADDSKPPSSQKPAGVPGDLGNGLIIYGTESGEKLIAVRDIAPQLYQDGLELSNKDKTGKLDALRTKYGQPTFAKSDPLQLKTGTEENAPTVGDKAMIDLYNLYKAKVDSGEIAAGDPREKFVRATDAQRLLASGYDLLTYRDIPKTINWGLLGHSNLGGTDREYGPTEKLSAFDMRSMINSGKLQQVLHECLGDKRIANDYLSCRDGALKLAEKLPGASELETQLVTMLSSDEYVSMLQALYDSGRAPDAQEMIKQDLTSLSILDPAKVDEANQNLLLNIADKQTQLLLQHPEKLDDNTVRTATEDRLNLVLTSLKGTKSGIGVVRHSSDTAKAIDLFLKDKNNVDHLGATIKQIVIDNVKNGRNVTHGLTSENFQRLNLTPAQLEAYMEKAHIPFADRKGVVGFIGTMQKNGAWGVIGGGIALASFGYQVGSLGAYGSSSSAIERWKASNDLISFLSTTNHFTKALAYLNDGIRGNEPGTTRTNLGLDLTDPEMTGGPKNKPVGPGALSNASAMLGDPMVQITLADVMNNQQAANPGAPLNSPQSNATGSSSSSGLSSSGAEPSSPSSLSIGDPYDTPIAVAHGPGSSSTTNADPAGSPSSLVLGSDRPNSPASTSINPPTFHLDPESPSIVGNPVFHHEPGSPSVSANPVFHDSPNSPSSVGPVFHADPIPAPANELMTKDAAKVNGLRFLKFLGTATDLAGFGDTVIGAMTIDSARKNGNAVGQATGTLQLIGGTSAGLSGVFGLAGLYGSGSIAVSMGALVGPLAIGGAILGIAGIGTALVSNAISEQNAKHDATGDQGNEFFRLANAGLLSDDWGDKLEFARYSYATYGNDNHPVTMSLWEAQQPEWDIFKNRPMRDGSSDSRLESGAHKKW